MSSKKHARRTEVDLGAQWPESEERAPEPRPELIEMQGRGVSLLGRGLAGADDELIDEGQELIEEAGRLMHEDRALGGDWLTVGPLIFGIGDLAHGSRSGDLKRLSNAARLLQGFQPVGGEGSRPAWTGGIAYLAGVAGLNAWVAGSTEQTPDLIAVHLGRARDQFIEHGDLESARKSLTLLQAVDRGQVREGVAIDLAGLRKLVVGLHPELDAALAEPTAEVDSYRETVLRTKGDEREEGRIARDAAAPSTKIDVGEDFAGAVGALKSRLVPTVTDQDIADLEAVLRAAQQDPPEDAVGFVRDFRRMLGAGDLRLQIDGEPGSVTLGMKNGSLAFTISGKGMRSFKTTEVGVERCEELSFAPRAPRRSSTAREPS